MFNTKQVTQLSARLFSYCEGLLSQICVWLFSLPLQNWSDVRLTWIYRTLVHLTSLQTQTHKHTVFCFLIILLLSSEWHLASSVSHSIPRSCMLWKLMISSLDKTHKDLFISWRESRTGCSATELPPPPTDVSRVRYSGVLPGPRVSFRINCSCTVSD